MTVSSEWKTAEEQLQFWGSEHNYPQHSKLLLRKQLRLAASIYCLNCGVTKVRRGR
jgi:hypothetical protein